MTASKLARILRAKPVRWKRNKWMARCPAHPDHHPSLEISEGRKHPVILICRSNHCSTASILAAIGLTWADLCQERHFDREAYKAIQRERARQEAKEREKRSVYSRLCYQARFWEYQAGMSGKLLASKPEDDTLAALFHRSLRNVRIVNATLATLVDSRDFPSETIVARDKRGSVW